MTTPINHRVPAVFVPVRDIYAARQWYAEMLDLEPGEVRFGHLCVIEMEVGSSNLVLDEMPRWREDDADICIHRVPTVQLGTEDIHEAFSHLEAKGVKLVTQVEDDFFFVFEDLDGNRLMVCQC